ncbi:MAG: metallophosphatase family protein [bacterium]|nr:metallophosphatase family protein [bacterium]
MTDGPPFYRIGVIADTHGFVHPKVFDVFIGVQLILHAGDIGNEAVLDELETLAPVRAVSGNVDGVPDSRRRPMTQRLETPAGRIAVIHGHLAKANAGDAEALLAYLRPFKPDIVVFGHSHVPYCGQCGAVVFFNPGSAGRGRLGRSPSVGLITMPSERARPVFEHIMLD